MSAAVELLGGRGLFTGSMAQVRLQRCTGPSVLRVGGESAAFSACIAEARGWSTCWVLPSGTRLGSVEHLAAAAAAHGAHQGLSVDVQGVEMPLLDGAAWQWSEALRRLQLAASPAPLRILRAGAVQVGGSRYVFEPGASRCIEVELRTDDARLGRHAAWDGTYASFARDIAACRTFAFAHDLHSARGTFAHVEPCQVVLIDPQTIHAAGRAFEADEPVRHKLLDLMGDLFVHGGPPLGTVRALAPGHAATHAAVRQARIEGLLS